MKLHEGSLRALVVYPLVWRWRVVLAGIDSVNNAATSQRLARIEYCVPGDTRDTRHGSQQITHPSMVMCVYWYWHYLMQNIVTMTASVSSPDWPIVCLLIILVAGGSWHRDNGAVCVTAWHGVMLIVGTLSTVDTQTAGSVTLHTPAQINHLGQGGVTTTNTQLSSCHLHVNNNC